MADAHGSGPCVRKDVRVQLPPRPPIVAESAPLVEEARLLCGGRTPAPPRRAAPPPDPGRWSPRADPSCWVPRVGSLGLASGRGFGGGHVGRVPRGGSHWVRFASSTRRWSPW